jgi:hypothetical protein
MIRLQLALASSDVILGYAVGELSRKPELEILVSVDVLTLLAEWRVLQGREI